MTDLLSRPKPASAAAARSSSRTVGRPLPVSTTLAAAFCAGGSLVICMALALTGWFLSDAGAHGETTSALGIGTAIWLLGHGADVQFTGAQLDLLPLGMTLLLAVAAYRSGHWAGRSSEPVGPSEADRNSLVFKPAKHAVEKALALAVGLFVAVYVSLAVFAAVLIPPSVASVSVPGATLGSLLISLCFGGAGVLVGTGHAATWWERVPGFLRVSLRGAVMSALLVLAAGALMAAVQLVVNFNRAASVVSGLGLDGGDLVMFALANLLLAPNAALFGVSYVSGPGFAVGTGTIVSASQVSLGPVPALPWFASLPAPGAPPAALLAVLAVPALAGIIAAVAAQRIYAVPALDSAALRGFASGFCGAALLALGCWLAGGSLGDGRMAQIGPDGWEVLLTAGAAMSLGGLAGGVATAWWQRRGTRTGAETT